MRKGCACDVNSGDAYLYCSVYNLDDLLLTCYGACNIPGDPRATDVVDDDARDVQNTSDDLDNYMSLSEDPKSFWDFHEIYEALQLGLEHGSILSGR